ncbi:MAG: GNAT family N-acetyltransferase [Desulfobacter sp.]|nr:MAG: GNAT family N-acetyltransferase [Desulfobacter sp.]
MEIKIKYDTKNIDWNKIADTLKSVGMAHYEPQKHKKAFQASYRTVFLFDRKVMVGFGRAISDGAYQAAIYDCAVIKDYQGRGLGKLIVQELLSALPECNVILYASPGKEGFYENLNFKRMKTGMAYFLNRDRMTAKGFTE